MNGTIEDVITALRRQWGEVYVTVTDNTAQIEELRAKMAEMSAHSTRMMNFALACACVGFVLAVTAAAILIYQRTQIGKHKERL